MSKLIQLELPQRSKPAKDSFDIRSRKVEQWIEGLPMVNLGETARLLYGALKETNQLNYNYQERYQFLELLREPVSYIVDAMKKHFVGVTFPLPEKNQKIAAATREILNAMALGYKITLDDLVKNNLLFPDKKLLATLIHRATSYSNQVLLTCYQIYAPYPAKSWKEIYQLYRFAEKRKVHKISIGDMQHRYVEKTSINDEFLRVILLSLTSPYHLRLGEVSKVNDTLERWSHECEISDDDVSEHDKHKNYFLVNLASDMPPSALSLSKHQLEQAGQLDCRVIDVSELAHLVRDEIRETQDIVSTTLTSLDMSRPNLSHDLLKRLLIAWGGASKRHFPRNTRQEQVQITLGLSATHEYINHRRDNPQNSGQPQDSFEHEAHFKSKDIPDMNKSEADVWSMVYPSADSLNYHFPQDKADTQQPPQAKQVETAAKYRVDDWVILNESANGYCIEQLKNDNNKVQVGELIGIKRPSGTSWKWGIGVIRWMKFSPDNHLHVGIQMMNPNAAAIGLRSTAGHDNYQRSLMLPELSAINQPATLITGPVPWRAGNQVTIKILGKQIPVLLTRQLQNTGHFAQFEFTIQDNQPEKPNEDNKDWLNDQDFNNVWSSI